MAKFGCMLFGLSCLIWCMQEATGVTTVFIEDCQPGKYFWQEKKPTQFFACLSKPRKAVKMQCSLGAYMCDTGPKVFQPCNCKGDFPGANEIKSKEKSVTLGKPKYKNSENEYELGMDITELPRLDDPSDSENDINSLTVNRENEVAVDSMPYNGCPDDPFKLVNNAHMYRGKPIDGTLVECEQKCIDKASCLGVDYNRETKQCYYLDIDERETIRYGLNYHKDIDHYRRTHCYSTVAPYGKEDATEPMTTPSGTTASPFTDTTVAGGRGFARTVDPGTPPPDTTPASATTDSATADPVTSSTEGTSTTTQSPPTQGPTTDTDGPTDGPRSTPSPSGGQDRNDDTTDRTSHFDLPRFVYRPSTPDPNVTPQNAVPTTTTTFPDTGCPFSFEKFEDTSHPFGVTVPDIFDMEACKLWCLKFGFCMGVDFDMDSNTCFYLREIMKDTVIYQYGITHFRKNICAPPLKCWSEDRFVYSEAQLAVTDENTPQTACHGFCFVSQSINGKGTPTQRGCMTMTDPTLKDIPRGCSIDSTMKTLVCFCNTNRCNGLSTEAMASQILYLPLDGSLTDHSGNGRDGSVSSGKNAPEYSCLDKAVNCSAIFDGSACVAVSGLSQVQWGSPDHSGTNFIPTFSTAVWFKRATTSESAKAQGIFGNSLDSSQPSWHIIAESLNHFLGAGVSTAGNPELSDYPYLPASNDDWHLITMTYNGVEDKARKQFSLLKLYIDGKPQMGNARADRGEIGVRSQAVSVGCVQEMDGFIGFIDEARLFNMVLDPANIKALQVMRDSSSYI